ncbi:hypothetical protein FGO68_gene15402 [Halteria grandinella]|uniref:Uncharacterized protein n=1 Tax=Halteria grandinella TaxID=5974 RepID=A0A8J8SVL6_HALGN|nr:hypothetical protein FGO68_gene15402 [Halteria grandinella]
MPQQFPSWFLRQFQHHFPTSFFFKNQQPLLIWKFDTLSADKIKASQSHNLTSSIIFMLKRIIILWHLLYQRARNIMTNFESKLQNEDTFNLYYTDTIRRHQFKIMQQIYSKGFQRYINQFKE